MAIRMIFALLMASSLGLQSQAPSTVTCELTGDSHARVYVLDRASASGDAGWRLSMKDRESGDKWIRLTLPGAEPVFGEGTARLSFRNGNGGRQVSLDVTPQGSRLDVFVDYGLDVNIEPDLDPEVDRMSTGGPVTAVSCRVATDAGAVR
jgi:hypothetical protein